MLYLFDEFDLLGENFVERCDGLLSEERRAAVSRLTAQSPKRQSAAAYLLLRYGLEKEFGINEAVNFDYNEYGKPLLAKFPHIHFNLSHCKSAAACVLSSMPVGVDVERISSVNDRLAKRVMTGEEYAEFQAADNKDEFFARLWTIKEAFLKKTGQGVGLGLLSPLSEAIKGVAPQSGEATKGVAPQSGKAPSDQSHAEIKTFRGKDYFCSVTDININVEKISAEDLISVKKFGM